MTEYEEMSLVLQYNCIPVYKLYRKKRALTKGMFISL